jgi:hypothetical protein
VIPLQLSNRVTVRVMLWVHSSNEIRYYSYVVHLCGEHLREYPISLPHSWFLEEKNSYLRVSRILSHLLAIGKQAGIVCKNMCNLSCAQRSSPRFFLGQSKGRRVWERIESRKWFLMLMYERGRIYKSSYDNKEYIKVITII